MFKHILVPVDGSKTSMLAVSKAAALAKTFGSAVTALYVIDPYPFTRRVGADFAYGQAQYLSAATAEANSALDATKKAMAEAGVQATAGGGRGPCGARWHSARAREHRRGPHRDGLAWPPGLGKAGCWAA